MKYATFVVVVCLAMVIPATARQQNAVPSTPKSVADGGNLYNRSCASCHGKAGTGDGPAAKQLNPKPSNLVDAEWAHGTSDSEIFAVIRSGVPKTAMKGFASKMTEREIWDILNYLRSMGPAPK